MACSVPTAPPKSFACLEGVSGIWTLVQRRLGEEAMRGTSAGIQSHRQRMMTGRGHEGSATHIRNTGKAGFQRQLAASAMGLLCTASLPLGAWAQERPIDPWGMHPMWGMWGAWGNAWGIGMMFMMLVFWGLIIVGVVLAIRWLLTQSRDSRADNALEILRQRYARGEIDKEEFEAKKRDLG